jgi:hypothetical protein
LKVGAVLSASTTEVLHTTEAPQYGKVVRRTATAGDYTLTRDDYIVGVTSTAAARAITIPAACLFDGQSYIITDESGACGTNNITITPTGANINGSATYVMNANYESVMIYSDGTNWFVAGGMYE